MEEILGNVDLQVEVEDIDAKLMAEEVVLTTNLVDEKVVEESLARIRQFENRITDENILDSRITEVLYTKVRLQYGVDKLAGRQCRRILQKIVKIAMNSSSADDDDELPEITFVADEEEQRPQQKPRKRKFGALFGNQERRSMILAEQGNKGSAVAELDSRVIPEPVIFSTADPQELHPLLEDLENLEDPEDLSTAVVSQSGSSVLHLTQVDDSMAERIKDLPKRRKRVNR